MAKVNSNTRIYIANLGKYNEGILQGKWFDLPLCETWDEIKARIGLNDEYEECAIHDYETDIDGLTIGEYDNIEDLSDMISAYEDLDEWQAQTAAAAVSYFGYKLTEVIDRIDDFNLMSDIKDDYDLGYYYAVESGCYEIDDKNPLSNYIDYERFGCDIGFDISGGHTEYGFIEEMR